MVVQMKTEEEKHNGLTWFGLISWTRYFARSHNGQIKEMRKNRINKWARTNQQLTIRIHCVSCSCILLFFFAKTLGFVDTKLLDKFCYSIAVEIFVLIDCNNLFIGQIDYYIVHMYFIVQTEGVWWKNCRPKMLL